MKLATTRLSLAVVALVASVTLARAQTAGEDAGAQDAAQATSVPTITSQAGMPMTAPVGQSGMPVGKPAAMGGDMGGMMEMMRLVMAGREIDGDPVGMRTLFEHVEGRIAYLKAELKITDAQTAQWNTFADALRTNAAAIKNLHEHITKEGMPGSWPDRLAFQKKMMSAHLGALERVEAGAKPLYAALSEEQKKLIDQMMSGPMGRM